MNAPNLPSPDKKVKIRVKYDDMNARYASQVIINATQEEVFLEFSTGTLPDPNSNDSVLPVHTRIVMTHSGARRLLQALSQTFSGNQQVSGQIPLTPSNPAPKPAAVSAPAQAPAPAKDKKPGESQKASLPSL